MRRVCDILLMLIVCISSLLSLCKMAPLVETRGSVANLKQTSVFLCICCHWWNTLLQPFWCMIGWWAPIASIAAGYSTRFCSINTSHTDTEFTRTEVLINIKAYSFTRVTGSEWLEVLGEETAMPISQHSWIKQWCLCKDGPLMWLCLDMKQMRWPCPGRRPESRGSDREEPLWLKALSLCSPFRLPPSCRGYKCSAVTLPLIVWSIRRHSRTCLLKHVTVTVMLPAISKIIGPI